MLHVVGLEQFPDTAVLHAVEQVGRAADVLAADVDLRDRLVITSYSIHYTKLYDLVT